MRRLGAASAAAALLFAPAFALPVSRTHHEDTDLATRPVEETGGSSFFITLSTEVSPSQEQPLTLRLDVEESDSICDADRVAINDQSISPHVSGRGEGPLQLDNEVAISAEWAFTCLTSDDDQASNPSLVLEMTVTGQDGQPLVNEVYFVAHFQQSTSVELVSVSSPHFGKDGGVYVETNEDPEPAYRRFVVEEEELLEDTEVFYKVRRPSPKQSESKTEHTSEKCHSWKCYVKSFTKDVMEKADRLCTEIIAKKNQWQGHPARPNSDKVPTNGGQPLVGTKTEPANHPQGHGSDVQEQGSHAGEQEGHFWIVAGPTKNRKMKPIAAIDDSTPAVDVVPTPTPTARFMPPLAPPDQDLVMTLTIAAAFFSLFTIIGIIAGSRRLAPHIQRRPRHRETCEERLARVAERRRAVRNFFSGLFCGIFGYEEKKDGEEPQGRDLRHNGTGAQRQDAGDTTMEQELASFRNAADMVSSLIAAEEGRNHQVPHQHHERQRVVEQPRELPQIPDAAQAAYPGYFPGEAPPPSYENDAAEASMVADGFQYTPGGATYSRSNPVNQQGSNSDRLGYGNKD